MDQLEDLLENLHIYDKINELTTSLMRGQSVCVYAGFQNQVFTHTIKLNNSTLKSVHERVFHSHKITDKDNFQQVKEGLMNIYFKIQCNYINVEGLNT